MSTLIVNVDAGEHDDHQLDLELLQYVDALNIGLGGHAGDPKWSQQLAKRAMESGKRVHLHPGYPDRQRFGRVELDIPWTELAESLTVQRAVLPDVTACKFHGAIYNRSIVDAEFAQRLVQWCDKDGIDCLVTMDDSCLAGVAQDSGITVLRESFVDRRYVWTGDRLALQSRSESGAVITDVSDVLRQAKSIDEGNIVLADGTQRAIRCDTICFHGDSVNALALAKAIDEWKHDR